jgi:hypothetical protein
MDLAELTLEMHNFVRAMGWYEPRTLRLSSPPSRNPERWTEHLHPPLSFSPNPAHGRFLAAR